jgi:hypothetical protein
MHPYYLHKACSQIKMRDNDKRLSKAQIKILVGLNRESMNKQKVAVWKQQNLR